MSLTSKLEINSKEVPTTKLNQKEIRVMVRLQFKLIIYYLKDREKKRLLLLYQLPKLPSYH